MIFHVIQKKLLETIVIFKWNIIIIKNKFKAQKILKILSNLKKINIFII